MKSPDHAPVLVRPPAHTTKSGVRAGHHGGVSGGMGRDYMSNRQNTPYGQVVLGPVRILKGFVSLAKR